MGLMRGKGSEGLLTGRDDLWGAMTMVLVLFNLRGIISPLLAFIGWIVFGCYYCLQVINLNLHFYHKRHTVILKGLLYII